MTTYILLDGELVPVTRMPRPRVFPGIIRDSMDALVHPANGRRYDSKSQFRRVTAEHGMVELGNDAPTSNPEFKPEGIRDDIEKSVAMLKEGYQPDPDGMLGDLDGNPVETRFIE